MTDPINEYLKRTAEIASSGATDSETTELSFRTPIENLLNALAPSQVNILQEPSRTHDIGAPDFRVSNQGGGVIGYVECKPPGADLHKLTTSAQLKKYRALSGNIVLTDSWRWLLLRDGKRVGDVTLARKSTKQTKEDFVSLLQLFMQAEAEKIGDAKRLAEALATRCAILHKGLETHANDDPISSRLHSLLEDFRAALNPGLSFSQFADTFAQTLVYSLLLAKLKAPANTTLDLYGINRHIPDNFAVIRDITTFLEDLNKSEYEHVAWVVGDILAIVNAMDAAAVAESMTYRRNNPGFDDADDPYIYFYENFLAVYDPEQRERRGVYYTPPPVVKFIIRAVDDLLRRDFGLADGLAESSTVTALDFATGTGTFMLEMIRTVLADKSPAQRNMLAHNHILKHFNGFELLMAPYVIAHLKLSQFLADNDVSLEGKRINVFLTNTLEEVSKQQSLRMMPSLADDMNRAQTIKDLPVLVITGNPPYSVTSQNNGEEISNLIEDYKKVDKGERKEHNLKLLQDDYVKFIRFAQNKMKNVERGIVAIITNHGFLDNPTFGGMRKSLLDAFDALYFLDLHGNANKKETTPDGDKDENVFDIRQGVAISILVKNSSAKRKSVFHADLYGTRASKYDACLENDINTVKWRKIKPVSPFYLFVPRDEKSAKVYNKHPSITKIFIAQSTGIKSHRDHFAFDYEKQTIEKRIADMGNKALSDSEFQKIYNVRETRDWKLSDARRKVRTHKNLDEYIRRCSYRPFDMRWCFHGSETMDLPRPEVMSHMVTGENLGLVTVRQVAEREFNHVIVVDTIIESRMTLSNKGMGYLYPLYRYDKTVDTVIRNENIEPTFRQKIDDHYGTAHTPEDIFGCIYAILHSPDYRKRYADFLRIDFPRIPFPEQDNEFKRLAAIGNELINAHLLRANCTGDLADLCGDGTTHTVEKVRYVDTNERLYFNPKEYLAPIPPEVFTFQIGGYQPLDKYLKSRKNRTLNLADTETLKSAANAIAFTIEKMCEIDQ